MAQQKRRILLHSGWNRYNFGDVAHTPGILHLLQKHIPEAELWLWMARYPEWLDGYIRERFPQIKTVQGQLGGIKDEIDTALVTAYSEADLFLYNSGPTFNYGHEIVSQYIKHTGWRGFDWNATMAPLAKLYYAKHVGLPFGIFGQSFNYFAKPADMVVPEIFSQAAFLSTRETDSLRYLQSLGVQANNMDFCPDAAWAFDLWDDETVLPWLHKLGLKEREFLAVTTRNAPAGVDEGLDGEKQRTFFRQVVTDWVQETGLPVLLVPETATSIQLNKDYILAPLSAEVKAKVIVDDSLWIPETEFWTPDQALSLLSRARCYVNVDHHGLLLALPAGTPCLHARQPQAGRKSKVFEDLDLADWLFDLYTVDPKVVSQTLLDIHRNYAQAQQRARKAAQTARAQQDKQMQIIRRVLGLG